MRKTVYLLGLSLACCTGGAIASCGSSGGTTGTGASTASTMSAGSGGMGGKTSTGTTMGEGGSFFDAGFGDGSTERDGDACGSVALKGTVTPGHIIVVFDQSDSMGNKFTTMDGGTTEPDGGPLPPKWEAAEDALVAAVTPIENLLELGAIFIPTGADGACTVAPITTSPQIKIEPGPMFLTDFQAHFTGSWKLILGTPLEQGLAAANTALMPAPTPGKSAIVVMTDGAPNCGYSTLAEVEPPIQAMESRGIDTYVIGLPGSESASNLLNGLAVAGGTGSYYSPNDPADLQNKLAEIASNTVDQCTITLSPPPADPNMVYLIVTDAQDPNGVVIPESADGGGNGWSLGADGMTATLLGTTCTNAKDGAYTSINFVYGCPTLPQ